MRWPFPLSTAPIVAICVLLTALSTSRAAALSPDDGLLFIPPLPKAETNPVALESLRRLVHCYDFEEAELAPHEFPLHFIRNLAPDRGFPAFGRVALARDIAFRGHWAFRFDLERGSLSAGIPSGVLPILPMADYIIAVKVRTQDLEHAGARIAAAFHDEAGAPIAGSRVESTTIRTGGKWDTLVIRLRGEYINATDLVFELQLLQPAQMAQADGAHQLLAQDISGSAWFDDLTVWHVPRIDMTMSAPLNIVRKPRTPKLNIQVRDLAQDALTAELTIFDLADEPVYERTFPAPRGQHPVAIDLPLDRCGWYRARLQVLSGTRPAGLAQLSFVVLPERRAPTSASADAQLGVHLPRVATDRLHSIPQIVRQLEVGAISWIAWDAEAPATPGDDRFSAMQRAIEALLTSDLDMTFTLDAIPRAIASPLGYDSHQVLELISDDPALWRPYLDEMLINFGLRVRRWQIGSAEHPDAFWKEDLTERMGRIADSLSQLIPDPAVVIPFDADQQIPDDSKLNAVHVAVSSAVHPTALEQYIADWRSDGRSLTVGLETLPADPYTPRQQVIDLLQRGLHGWRAGLAQMMIDIPWRWEQGTNRIDPDPAFAAWRGLADMLRARRFAGELPLDEGLHCWLMEGDGRDSAMVLWSDQAPGDPPRIMQLVLADGPVRLIDPFGNATIIEPTDGGHVISITDMPVIVERIDLALAQFRRGFSLDPVFIPAQHRLHEHDIVIHNPWNEGVTGTIRLIETPGCRINPLHHDFIISAGESVRLPVSLVFNRSVIAGTRKLEAQVRIAADREYNVRVQSEYDIGWKNLEVTATWHVLPNRISGEDDLVIAQRVFNRGDEIVNLDAFIHAPGYGQDRRIIAQLEPDQSVIKTFVIPNGAVLISGKSIRLTVAERDGVAQLNHLLSIPDLRDDTATAHQDGSAARPADE